MILIGISDLHGYLPTIPRFDLLIIAGDICPVVNHGVRYQEDWIFHKFIPWLKNLEYNDEFSKVIFIGGNHDKIFEKKSKVGEVITLETRGNAIFLQDSGYNFVNTEVDWKIYGTPYCHIFGNWSFMKSDEKLKEIYSRIPENLDILITHDVPYNTNCDYTQFGKIRHAGNEVLREAILEKKPRINICGHLHDPINNIEDTLGDTKIYNVASVDELYQLKENYYSII